MLRFAVATGALLAALSLVNCGVFSTACVQGHDMGSYIDKYCYDGWSEDDCSTGDDFTEFHDGTTCDELGYDVECDGSSRLEDSASEC